MYVWFLKTGRLLDVLPGHEGPVTSLAFSPTDPILASSSWDKTVRLWDVYDGKGVLESLDHSHDVLALAFRPDGKQLASATLDGSIYFWNPQEGDLQVREGEGGQGEGRMGRVLGFDAGGCGVLRDGRVWKIKGGGLGWWGWVLQGWQN